MGANSTQAIAVTLFLLGFTALPVGLARGSAIYYVVALVLVGVSVAIFMKCKPLENAEN
jgi:hypothetical protein